MGIIKKLIVKTASENLAQIKDLLKIHFDECQVCFDYFYPKHPEGRKPRCEECRAKDHPVQ